MLVGVHGCLATDDDDLSTYSICYILNQSRRDAHRPPVSMLVRRLAILHHTWRGCEFMSSRPSAAGGSGGSCVSDQTFYVCKGLDLEHAASGAMGLKACRHH